MKYECKSCAFSKHFHSERLVSKALKNSWASKKVAYCRSERDKRRQEAGGFIRHVETAET